MSLVSGAPQVFPHPVEVEDCYGAALAFVVVSDGGDDLDSLEWHGDAVVTGPVTPPGGGEEAFAADIALAVTAGFSARVSGKTVYFFRDTPLAPNGYGGIAYSMSGAASVVRCHAVRTVVQDTRYVPLGPTDQQLADATDPDGGNVDAVGASFYGYILDVATYTTHLVDGTTVRVLGGARPDQPMDWEGRKRRVTLTPPPATRDWDALEAITGVPDKWGDDHPVLQIPPFEATINVTNLDGAAVAYVDGVALGPGATAFIECTSIPVIVTPSAGGCRVEFIVDQY